MANPEQVELLKRGYQAWNSWRNELVNASEVTLDLKEADLEGARLRRVDLRGCDLSGSSLREAVLTRADLGGANLSAVDLTDADLKLARLVDVDLSNATLQNARLIQTDLRGASLVHTNLRGADLSDANFLQADLTGADFTGAELVRTVLGWGGIGGARFTDVMLGRTVFVNLDLRNVFDLNTCRHWWPSSVDHLTLERSGKLPLNFLRGCGFADSWIHYLYSLLETPIQFSSCFISYSTADQDFADRLHADLQDKGVRCWFAPHHMEPGKKMHEQVDEAIRVLTGCC